VAHAKCDSPARGRARAEVIALLHSFSGTDIPVFLLSIFSKDEKSDLTPKERQILKRVLAEIVKTYRSGKE
jgi:hypothetical protein